VAKSSRPEIEFSGHQAIDHRISNPVPNQHGLTYPFEGVPGGHKVIIVAPGIFWARIPLPWSLDHINVYLFEEDGGWTVVDTGANGKTGMETWEKLEASVLRGLPIKRVIATHLHPDHLGLAGWLVERHGAEFWATQAEYLLANTLWMGASEVFPESELKFMFQSGVDRAHEAKIRAGGFGNYKKGVYALPPSYTRMEDGSEFMIGNRKWRVLIGRGHSPEHACLFCLDDPLLISGDQILPEITSNVSVHGREPMANPLAHWLSSLDRMKNLPGNPLVLPSHGPAFFGAVTRLDAVIESHLGKLARLHEWCEEPKSAVKTFRVLFRRKIEGMEFFLALGEALAHLHLLESLGLMKRDLVDDVYQFTSVGSFDKLSIVAATNQLPGVALRKIVDFFE
jgi:glyoxylase-like metal-dependent hydrolase (beta-lactamase superfamily II)